ncbi:MAG: Nif11-like leader peptide family natural product precursor [Ruminiclostridium sp.]|nr:Nif11-like leader peptide family natural product precursor [Ruminiclostridium sp.]MBP3856217.1 Nif11-like leader peptide family natural product precursor [Ruminiclostridium sp.]
MSKESAKKLISELQTNEELKAKIAGITDIAELTKKAVESGYDVTEAELIEAEKEQRAAQAAKTDDKLSMDDLEAAAGGVLWIDEVAPDGHEFNCILCFHGKSWCEENDTWCTHAYYCRANAWDKERNKDGTYAH